MTRFFWSVVEDTFQATANAFHIAAILPQRVADTAWDHLKESE